MRTPLRSLRLAPARAPRVTRALATAALAAAAVTVLPGCETDSFLDPSVVGRWEYTPVTMPILSELEAFAVNNRAELQTTPVRPEDLEPDTTEYVIGPGDLIIVTIFELIIPNQENVQRRLVNETGSIRLPVVGEVKAAGLSPSQLEAEIIDTLDRNGILRDATVSVVVERSGQNIYHIIGTPTQGGARFGTYGIPQPNFRILEAIALAGGVPERTSELLIFRQTPLTAEVAGTAAPSGEQQEVTPPATADPEALLDGLLDGGAAAPPAPVDENQAEDRPAPPSGVEAGLDSAGGGGSQWVYVDGNWVPAGQTTVNPETLEEEVVPNDDQLGEVITQRIIEVPYDRLINGDMRYNVVIRPGDIIRVPSQDAGVVYVMGQIARPGVFTVPGDRALTLKQLIAASGGLAGLAAPRKVDFVRRIGDDMETTVRLDLKAIFDGSEPDIFLKADDMVNIGSSGFAVPLAVIRNGFRATYGFGFIADRNFGTDIFGAPPRDNGN